MDHLSEQVKNCFHIILDHMLEEATAPHPDRDKVIRLKTNLKETFDHVIENRNEVIEKLEQLKTTGE